MFNNLLRYSWGWTVAVDVFSHLKITKNAKKADSWAIYIITEKRLNNTDNDNITLPRFLFLGVCVIFPSKSVAPALHM